MFEGGDDGVKNCAHIDNNTEENTFKDIAQRVAELISIANELFTSITTSILIVESLMRQKLVPDCTTSMMELVGNMTKIIDLLQKD